MLTDLEVWMDDEGGESVEIVSFPERETIGSA